MWTVEKRKRGGGRGEAKGEGEEGGNEVWGEGWWWWGGGKRERIGIVSVLLLTVQVCE